MLDIVDDPARTWFAAHPFTTSAIVSVLILLITVLNVDHVVRRRQLHQRERVIAAQAAIVGRQAQRTADLVRRVPADGSQRDAASDELRTYMAMLLVSAPVLIDAAPARRFLESAQRLGGLLSYALAQDDDHPASGARLAAAAADVEEAARPLVSILDLDQLQAVAGGDDD